ncbi:MAG: hypothetical protein KA383_13035 [Phycisphaerae bacterium]|jgi:hypothetical protein|nr:hypothetical protein [Phycisphaerae bacterium]
MNHLAATLRTCRDLLDGYGVHGWRDIIDALLASPASDYDRALAAKSWFGGMGSLNDLVISPINGDRVAPEEVALANERLMTALNDLLVVANALIKARDRKQR